GRVGTYQHRAARRAARRGRALHRSTPVEHLRPRAVSPAFISLGHLGRRDHRPRALRLRGGGARRGAPTRAPGLSGRDLPQFPILEGRPGMDIRKIKKLIELLEESGIAEIEIKE